MGYIDVTELANAKTEAEVDAAAAKLNAAIMKNEAKANKAYAQQSIGDILLKNCEDSGEYFKLSLSHAKFSFWFSIVACSLGLIGVGLAVWQAFVMHNIQAALIPTIGAVIAEFIAATVFWVHRKSANQLNRYYDSLHEIEVFLSTIDVIQLMSWEKQDDAYQRVLDELFHIQKIKAEKDPYAKRKSKE